MPFWSDRAEGLAALHVHRAQLVENARQIDGVHEVLLPDRAAVYQM